MSYILDALRRAQAERGRGSVPGLHTPASPVAVPTVQRAAPARGLPWMVLAALAGVGAAAGAWWLVRAPSATVAAVVPAPAPRYRRLPLQPPPRRWPCRPMGQRLRPKLRPHPHQHQH
ncbi:hypothetical protein [Diaphorobacter sp. JS3050]|uniref:hypothetical protein n=1 Tax=Diaphorobacter sp. JS3050 TaxID=2735554 RepID=UPI0020A6CCE2|nr:hypothetical protein [Diaphorobacter sp. JS3050]